MSIDAPPAIHAPAMPAYAVDHGRVLLCIIELEQHKWNWPGGALAFQVTSWTEDTALPYDKASNPAAAIAVANKRLSRFARIAASHGVKWTPTVAFDSWRWGIDAAIRKAKSPKKRQPLEYAVRGANLYNDRTFQ
jgi:hypothetical protein